MGVLQQLGRSLMLPTMIIPVAAILLGLGAIPWDYLGAPQFSPWFTDLGHTVFHYMPVIFAVGVALGLTQNAGLAGMSAMLGYFLFTEAIAYFLAKPFPLGVAGGVLIGLLTALSYHMCKNLRLPEYIQFFGGTRMVPLLTSIFSLFASFLMIGIGPYIDQGMEKISLFFLNLGGIGTFLYGVSDRFLIPFGLHHILNNFFWFQLGAFEWSPQEFVFGDLPRFFAGDPQAGRYMAGLYPITMFALPAVAFAIIHESRRQFSSKVKAIFLTAALACFLTGVTEPIEFAFLFVAPYLFVLHALLTGSAMWITYEWGIRHGFSYSAGAIDYIINFHLSENGFWLIPIGMVYGIVYYVLFRIAIRRFSIPTPGREEGTSFANWEHDLPQKIPQIIQALGGRSNILEVEACMTRLRLTLLNIRWMKTRTLKKLGAAGVIHLGFGNVQVVFGTYSELIRQEIVKFIHQTNRSLHFHSPVEGKMIPLALVPDEIYAKKIVGDGVAFYPESGICVSPIKGKVIHIFPSGHALGIQTMEGVDILIHIGIDSMNVQGFSLHVKEGDEVQPGQVLITFPFKKLKQQAKSTAVMMIITNPVIVEKWHFAQYTDVRKGQFSVMSIELKSHKSLGDDLP